MMASPLTEQSVNTQAIPIRRVLLTDPSDLPNHYSQTPGGTLFSTTPGGTRIVYEKNFLLNLRNSPISNTPPKYDLPDKLIKGNDNSPPKKPYYNNNNRRRSSLTTKIRRNSQQSDRRGSHPKDDDQFQLDL